MARLRSPLRLSEANTASSTSSSRPAKRPSAWRIYSNAPSPLASRIRPVQVIAPALTIALNGMVVGVEADRIEGIAGRFDADRALHPRRAQRIQRQREHEGLRHRLDGEGNPGIAGLVDMAVEGGETDAEMGRISLAELRNVIGDGAAGIGGKLRVATVEEPQQRRFRGGPGGGRGGKGLRRRFHRLQSCRAIRGRATGSASAGAGASAPARPAPSAPGSTDRCCVICNCDSGLMPPPGVAITKPPMTSSTRSGHSSAPVRRRSPTKA